MVYLNTNCVFQLNYGINQQPLPVLQTNFWYVTQHAERRTRDLSDIRPINDRPYSVANDLDPSTFSIDLLCSEFSSLLRFCMWELRHPGEGLLEQAVYQVAKEMISIKVRQNYRRSIIRTIPTIVIHSQYSKSSLFSRFAFRIMRASYAFRFPSSIFFRSRASRSLFARSTSNWKEPGLAR